MQRRTFLKTSLATATAGTAVAAAPAVGPDYFELRTWSLAAANQPRLDTYLSRALLPALKRLGCGPTGVFVESQPNSEVKVHVLLSHASPEVLTTWTTRVAADAEHQRAAADYLNAPASAPVYTRIESSLLAGIEGLPRLAKTDPAKPRLFNLRVYESHNERAAAKKVEMFNGGELAIFQRVGLTPVMFGRALSGAAMPNLTYLLVFPDDNARQQAWNKFRADPEWLKLKAIPEYADKEIVLRITNRLLTPAPYSEL